MKYNKGFVEYSSRNLVLKRNEQKSYCIHPLVGGYSKCNGG